MRMRTLEISVGAFMLAGFLALLFLAVQVSGITLERGTGTYTLEARFSDVAGIRTRAKVNMAGVTVGRVTAINVDAEYAEAILTLEIDAGVRLPKDSGAAIQTEGILGGRYVALLPGVDDEYLAAGDTITYTQSAMVLENLIGDFLINLGGS
jgi:phospholipid/cholesterol/gamma-HCH transport system substrate-binding protein